MAKRYLYVLSGYAGAEALAPLANEPVFEYQRFVQTTGADIISLTDISDARRRIKTRLTGKLLLQRLRLAALVACRANSYDAIVASGEDIGILVALALRIVRRRTPLVIVTHGPQFESYKFRLVLAMVRSMPNVIFACLSRSLAEWLVAQHGVDARRAQATGYGIDTDYFQADPAPTQIIVASAGSSNRDYDTLVLAVTTTGIDTRIAAHSAWVGTAAPLRVENPDHVEVRSYGTYANLRDLYRFARVVAVPTRDVPFAAGFAVIAQAMAMGKPVIATQGRVISDFIIPGVTGLLVPPGDVEALREAIVSLVKDPDRAARMGKAAATLMRERYSLERYVERLKAATELS